MALSIAAVNACQGPTFPYETTFKFTKSGFLFGSNQTNNQTDRGENVTPLVSIQYPYHLSFIGRGGSNSQSDIGREAGLHPGQVPYEISGI